MQDRIGINEENDEYDIEDEDESYNPQISKKNRGDKKNQLQRWEKNVRRRVYDALNVLYASGVLRKEGKHVFCD